jgi:hypothetical protein
MFVRFINHECDRRSQQKQGVFQVAYDLLRSDLITPEQWCRLNAAVRWFEGHLTIPDRARLNDRAIFWFRADAQNVIRRVWELSRLLRRCEMEVEMIRTVRPGYIIYHDCFQVAAIPFRDTFATR